MANILIIDDDRMICEMLSLVLRRMDHCVTSAHTLSSGLSNPALRNCDLVLLDVRLPDGNGLDAIRTLQGIDSAPQVIIITASGDQNGAELAIRSGAWDYIAKPSSIHDMTLPVVRALQYREEKKNKRLCGGDKPLKVDGIIGNSAKLKSSLEQLAHVAKSDINVLIAGETGTGKELFASALHVNSPRANKPFVVLDCSALPETLVESILFGHDRGAFTGAEKAREGLIKQADGGTLFLDEVGELPLAVQKAFLRVLQERRFRPIGSGVEIESNFRLVAATNRNLQKMADTGSFRNDLLFRLRSFVVELPPLRERPEDIVSLARHHIQKLCERHRIGLKGFSPEFLEALLTYKWPGNVRELFHALERALAAAFYEPTLFPQHLPDDIRIFMVKNSMEKETTAFREAEDGGSPLYADAFPRLRDYRENMDRKYLLELTTLTQGDIRESCRISGLSRSRLYDLLKHHHVAGSHLASA